MVPHTEAVSSRKRTKSDPTSTLVLLLLAFLAVCALLWFGYQNLKHPTDRYTSRIYKAASLMTESTAVAC